MQNDLARKSSAKRHLHFTKNSQVRDSGRQRLKGCFFGAKQAAKRGSGRLPALHQAISAGAEHAVIFQPRPASEFPPYLAGVQEIDSETNDHVIILCVLCVARSCCGPGRKSLVVWIEKEQPAGDDAKKQIFTARVRSRYQAEL